MVKKTTAIWLVLLFGIINIYIIFGNHKEVGNVEGVSPSYRDNVKYEARLSMFQLYDGQADVVFAGDSIVERANWEEFFGDIRCINRGIGSDVTEGLLNRIDECTSHKPKKIFVWIGVNDISYGIKLDAISEYMKSIVSFIHAADTDCRVYIVSVLPAAGIEQIRIDKVNEAYEEIAMNDEKVVYVDVADGFQDMGGYTATMVCI